VISGDVKAPLFHAELEPSRGSAPQCFLKNMLAGIELWTVEKSAASPPYFLKVSKGFVRVYPVPCVSSQRYVHGFKAHKASSLDLVRRDSRSSRR
jgi:hypothetical protein